MMTIAKAKKRRPRNPTPKSGSANHPPFLRPKMPLPRNNHPPAANGANRASSSEDRRKIPLLSRRCRGGGRARMRGVSSIAWRNARDFVWGVIGIGTVGRAVVVLAKVKKAKVEVLVSLVKVRRQLALRRPENPPAMATIATIIHRHWTTNVQTKTTQRERRTPPDSATAKGTASTPPRPPPEPPGTPPNSSSRGAAYRKSTARTPARIAPPAPGGGCTSRRGNCSGFGPRSKYRRTSLADRGGSRRRSAG
mmetsp:Transcript_24143/g.51184  ORF Transcript_24143/g.51184 Transcript_24143/m.51184 type:complete len:251 (-) Transcript_24143:375-1127(-)